MSLLVYDCYVFGIYIVVIICNVLFRFFKAYCVVLALDILFPSNHNIHKSLYGLCFWASVPLIDRFYWILWIKGPEAQKPKPHELLWMLWFDEKSISSQHTWSCKITLLFFALHPIIIWCWQRCCFFIAAGQILHTFNFSQ